MARFKLNLLGGCRLFHGGSGEEVNFRSRKARCLIGLVALSQDGKISREKLASFLWDPAPEEMARTSLRQCLKEIRDILGEQAEELISASRLDVTVGLENLEIDARTLLNLVAAAKADRNAAVAAARMWQGELFGDAVPSAPVFEAWVQVERLHVRSKVSNLLTDHLQFMLRKADYFSPDIAEELVRIEPSHELAHQYLMRFHAARGDMAGALRQYAQLSKQLADELDSDPSQESIDLLVAIKRGDLLTASPAVAAEVMPLTAEMPVVLPIPQGGVPRLVIRPPLTRSADESREYLSEGFANLLKVCMSRFRCWIMLSWPSSGFDSNIRIDYSALKAAVGADYTIDTVLDWRDTQGKLFVSLIDCTDGSQVWSDVFSVSDLELQSMSSSVAGAISSKLASRINHITLLRFARKKPADSEAYDYWLKGHQLSRAWSSTDDIEARRLFQLAIDRDPSLACAYASLASLVMTQGMVRPGRPMDEDIQKGFELAQKALALDPFDSRNHLSLAWSWLMHNSPERADSHFKLAVELNPFDSESLIASAMGSAFLGQLDQARKWAETALQLNPLHPDYFSGYLAAIRYLHGDYAGTLSALARSGDVFPEMRAWAAAAHAMLGHRDEAVKAFDGFLSLIKKRWEGISTPDWEKIRIWLEMAVPIRWQPGKAVLDAGLERAKAWHHAAGLQGDISGISA